MLPLHGQGTAAVENSSLGRMDLLYIQQAVFLLNRLNKSLPSSLFECWFELWGLMIYG